MHKVYTNGAHVSLSSLMQRPEVICQNCCKSKCPCYEMTSGWLYCSTNRGGNLPGSPNSFSGKCVVEKADCSQWSVANRQPWQRLIGPHGLNSQSKAQDEELSTNERGHRAQPAENGDMSPSLPSPSPHSAPLLVDLQRQASMLWSRAWWCPPILPFLAIIY